MKFGIFLFDGVEPIDIATIGVLSMAKRLTDQIEWVTLAPKAGIVNLANGLKVVADYGYEDAPKVDVLVITGGATWPQMSADPATLDFLRRCLSVDTTVSAVCTGSMILAASGALDGKQATTRCRGVPGENLPVKRMAENFPAIEVLDGMMLVDQGKVITGGGVCLCIDMMLHLIERHLGSKLAHDLAHMLEYDRAWAANKAALGQVLAA